MTVGLGPATPHGHGVEVADLNDDGLSYERVAERLGSSQSAVSQRAQAGGLVEGRRARELVNDLVAACVAEPK